MSKQTEWILYMLGFMTSKGWGFTKQAAEDFKRTFPDIPPDMVDLSTKEDKKET